MQKDQFFKSNSNSIFLAKHTEKTFLRIKLPRETAFFYQYERLAFKVQVTNGKKKL